MSYEFSSFGEKKFKNLKRTIAFFASIFIFYAIIQFFYSGKKW